MIRTEQTRQDLQISFQSAAEWRLRKAEEYPGDQRNRAAAEALERLAETTVAISTRTLEALAAAYDGLDFNVAERESEMLREVGFSSLPVSASEFVDTLLREMSGDAAVGE